MKIAQILPIVLTVLFGFFAIAGNGLASDNLTSDNHLHTPVRTIQANPVTLGPPATFGEWSEVMPWPVIAIHANLMPNGNVITWDATPDDFDDDPHTTENFTTRVTVWNPNTNQHFDTYNNTNADLFCAGSSHLWDGRILFAGGDSGIARQNDPLSNTTIYDPETNIWEKMPDMAAPRWYSSNASLANGETLTYGGNYDPVPVAEVFQHTENWRSLGFPVPDKLSINYQWMQATPDGKVTTFGPQSRITKISTDGAGRIEHGLERDEFPIRRYGSYAMYDIGKVLVAGGTEDEGGPFSFDSAVIIDTATQQTTATSPMTHARTQHNLTILADGSVLATGGNTSGAVLIDPEAAVLTPEVWSPDTGAWQQLNDMKVDRQYHTVALLLPDGTVLSAGGGYCGTCTELDYEEQNAEIFSPPYLFSSGSTLALRPVISLVPDLIDYNQSFVLHTATATAIEKVHLIKLGSVTHSVNQEQRLIPLEFQSSNSGMLEVNSPESRNIAPPGYYMLFIVDDSGVPSEATIVLVGQPLITPGKDVTHTAKAGKTDQYAINVDNSMDLLVTIEGHTDTTTLNVYSETANNISLTGCTESATAQQTLECRISSEENTRWLIEVSAENNSSYRLKTALSATPDTPATQLQPEQTAENQVASGGGGYSIAVFFLLLLRRRSIARRLS